LSSSDTENGSVSIRAGYQEGDISVERAECTVSGAERSCSTDVNVGYQEGDIQVQQNNISQTDELSFDQQPLAPVVAKDFHHGQPVEESPVFNLMLEAQKGFKVNEGTRTRITIANCSDEELKNITISVTGLIPDTLKSHKATIPVLAPKSERKQPIVMVPLHAGELLIQITIEYFNTRGQQFVFETTKYITVVSKHEHQTSGPQQIINNTFKVGYIDGNISTLQPMEVTTIQTSEQPSLPEAAGRRLKCRCGALIEPEIASCLKCGMKVITDCPTCRQRVDIIDLTCRCGQELHRGLKLKLRQLKSIGSLRAMLTVQSRGAGQTDWSDPIRYLLVRNLKQFKLGRYYKSDDEKHYNDVVLLVHCLDEPKPEQWKDSKSLTYKYSKGISRRQMDISLKDGQFHITWLKGNPRSKSTGIFIEKQKPDQDNTDKTALSCDAEKTNLCCNEEYVLSDGDIIGIRGQLQFRFKSFQGEVDKVGKVIGACLERRTGVLDIDRPIRYGEYEHYYRAYYLFKSILCIGGEGTKGLILDIPGISIDRFHIVEFKGSLKLIDQHRQNPKPREKIECF